MALRLRIVSSQAKVLGEAGSKVFGVHGGVIGRSTDSDWVLPDPERYVSSRHALIEYRGGSYWLTDTSSNGTYINDGTEPLSGSGPQELKDGDRLRIGDFDLVVSIDAANDFPPDKSAIVAYDGLGSSSAVRQSTDNDLGESLNLDVLLSESGSHSAITPVNAYGQAVDLPPLTPAPRAPRRPPNAAPAASARTSETGSSKQVPWNLKTRRIEPYRNPAANAAARPAVETSAAITPASSRPKSENSSYNDSLAGLQALCRGAGIDPAGIAPELQPQVLQIAGQILREVVLGLMEVLQARDELKNRFRISQGTIQPSDNNPLKFSAGVDEALRKLLESRNSRYLGPVEAIRDSFRDINSHHQALVAAMRGAFVEFLHQLDPEELRERFDRGLKRGGLLGATNKMKYWELYTELYQNLCQMPKDEMPHLFVEEFARTYETKAAELGTRSARGSGNDNPPRVPAAGGNS